MTNTVDNALLLEVLKKVQADVAFLKAEFSDFKTLQHRTREDINRFAGDFLRVERMQAETQVRLERIEHRLELTDA